MKKLDQVLENDIKIVFSAVYHMPYSYWITVSLLIVLHVAS